MSSDLLCSTPLLRRLEERYEHLPLMARAGQAAAEWAESRLADKNGPVLILCGPGNNGGDALEMARHLHTHGYPVTVVSIDSLPGKDPAAQKAFAAFLAENGRVDREIPSNRRWAMIVDGLFGIGLDRPMPAAHGQLVEQANQLARRDQAILLALDCPSGIQADTGVRLGVAIEASDTLCFLALHPGLLTGDGPDHAGCLHLATLGLTEAEIRASTPNNADLGYRVSPDHFASALRPRRLNTHKGSFGGVGILGGSQSMAGAALLSARAALKLGAGRVYVGLFDPDAPAFDPVFPELMLRHPDSVFQAEVQALVCGPGLGTSGEAAQCVERTLQSPLPVILDADALNLIALDKRLQALLRTRQVPTILTPHPAEAGRLFGISVPEIQHNRIQAARELAARFASTVALKGCGTVIATPDGRWWINRTGNPGMATAGMGDVLSGLIATLIAQNWTAESAVLAAVHLHGAAADALVQEGIGPIGMCASEIPDQARTIFNRWVQNAPH